MMRNSRWLLLLPILPLADCASPFLDLSYKHYLEASQLEDAIRASCPWENNESHDCFSVDVSCSILGDEEGFKGIVQALLPKESPTFVDSPVAISFVARGNRLTPKSIDGIFQALLSSAVNHTIQSAAATANQSNISSNMESGNSSGVLEARSSIVENGTSMSSATNPRRPWNLATLDVGWNPLQIDSPGWKAFLKSLQKLIQSAEVCPTTLHFDRCGLSPGACRAIGKGIIKRYAKGEKTQSPMPLSLHLCGNPDLGDSGAAAIAAAIRTVVGDGVRNVILDTLDFSACDIGDVGAEAIALALESCPGMCIRHLDLSNNKLSDVGAAAIGHALLSCGATSPAIETLDLSGNADIKDKSAVVLAEAVEKGLVSSIRLRSCHILADGAAAFGKALASLSKHNTTTASKRLIDLSGNPLGVLRGKTKKGGKYSASAIKSKATATTAAYFSMIRKGIAGGLKEYGVELGGNGGESDDEEETRNGMSGESTGDGDIDPGKARCGIKAFANAMLDSDARERTKGQSSSSSQSPLKCELGLRRCFLDHGAADALAAVLCHSKEELGIDLSIDVALNPVLEEEMTAAIQGDENHEEVLREMSDRYMDALEALRESRERAMAAARAAAARIQAEKDRESQWDAPETFADTPWEQDGWADEEQQDEWDSDADYEQDEEEEDYN